MLVFEAFGNKIKEDERHCINEKDLFPFWDLTNKNETSSKFNSTQTLINDIYLLQNKFGKPTIAGDRLAITITKEKEEV